MITFNEILGKNSIADVEISVQHNIENLLKCVNLLRAEWGKPLIVTSGLRTMQEHLRIYSLKGITDKSKIPMKSKHLYGQAVDFSDPTGELYSWAYNNQDKLAQWGIWCEKDTKGWLHCQSVPYGSYVSGKSRFFIP